jgi:cell division protein ZapA
MLDPQGGGVYCGKVFNLLGESAIMALDAVEQLTEQVPVDDFQALEDKIYRTIEMYKAARRATDYVAAGGGAVAERAGRDSRTRGEDAGADRYDCRGAGELEQRCQRMLMATASKNSTLKDAQNGSVRVEIFDQAYNLRGSDPEYILKLAEYVDSKMRAVAQATNTIDTVRLAVLAALNIADEYHLLKRKQDSGATDYQKRAHLLADALDEVLDEKRKAG